MADKTREKKEYLNLGRTLAENHFKTEASKTKEASEALPPVDRALFKAERFFTTNIFSWFYHYVRSRFGRKHKFQVYDDKKDTGIYKIPNDTKIICVADWASDTPESDVIGRKIASHAPDYTIHLGDTYFVGSPREIRHNFINKTSSWHRGSKGSFALMGNHEMYSRGIGYFDVLLPSMGIRSEETGKLQKQKASFFCLENDYWRIIGLDTGYNSIGAIPILENISFMEKLPWLGKILIPKCSLPEGLCEWLEKTVKPNQDKKGLIFLSHHQYCSAFEKEYDVPAQQLAKVVDNKRAVLWLWGHEHKLSIYGKYKSKDGITAYGRCIGNGGMPVELIKVQPSEQTIKDKPLVIYDNRRRETIGDIDIGFNGYSIMNFNNESLEIEHMDTSKRLLVEDWKANLSTGEVEGISLKQEEEKLTLVQDIGRGVK